MSLRKLYSTRAGPTADASTIAPPTLPLPTSKTSRHSLSLLREKRPMVQLYNLEPTTHNRQRRYWPPVASGELLVVGQRGFNSPHSRAYRFFLHDSESTAQPTGVCNMRAAAELF